MTQIELLTAPTVALTRGQRLEMLRRRHRAWLAREEQVERVVRIVAPQVRGEVMPSRATLDLLDDLVRPTVMVRAAGGEW